jgi:hypothetical protein
MSLHYDEGGRFDGRTIHHADGSLAYDAAEAYKGKSYDIGNVTKAYDAKGEFKGTNFRQQDGRIYYYDETGTYTGYSTIEGVNGEVINVVPVMSACDQRDSQKGCSN